MTQTKCNKNKKTKKINLKKKGNRKNVKFLN